MWFAGDRRDLLEQALGRPLIDDGTYIEGCMSRKKQVVPPRDRRPRLNSGASLAVSTADPQPLVGTRSGHSALDSCTRSRALHLCCL